ncbi:MAG: hypothetical protein BroJett042_14600 [Bacteroidota bacterium]|nr:MAG: hypothetical protein BroJett042_14600 [Bacteroidota bacterium]
MSTSELQLKLHQIIDQVNDQEVLKAIHTLLSAQVESVIKTIDGVPISKLELDELLEQAESDIANGRTIQQHDLKKEITTWRKK